MLLEPPFDAPVASATAPEPALEQPLEYLSSPPSPRPHKVLAILPKLL